MRYLSLFSGIEAATVAWDSLGFEPVAFAEIDKFASSLLADKYPHIPNLGDVTKITESQIKSLGKIDLIVFGSPCQDISVAGKRAGLEGARSGLFRTAINIIRWARQHCGLQFALWENVKGAFSSNQGRDFAEVVASMAGLHDVIPPPHGWGTEGAAVGDNGLLEWAVLDAQYFGVAQRRERVFAIVDFGDWASRSPILLERESLRGNPPSRRKKREGITESARAGAEKQWPADISCTLDTNFAKKWGCENQHINAGAPLFVPSMCYAIAGNWIGRKPENGGNGVAAYEDVSYTLTSTDRHAVAFAQNQRDEVRELAVAGSLSSQAGMKQQTYLAETVAYSFDSLASNSMKSGNPHSGCRQVELSKTLDTSSQCPSKNQGGIAVVFDCKASASHMPIPTNEVAPTLRSMHGEKTNGGGHLAVCVNQGIRYTVRRLTPLECERLQGFPDNYVAKLSDAQRYKALGNSMAVPVMRWIGEQIKRVSLWS